MTGTPSCLIVGTAGHFLIDACLKHAPFKLESGALSTQGSSHLLLMAIGTLVVLNERSLAIMHDGSGRVRYLGRQRVAVRTVMVRVDLRCPVGRRAMSWIVQP